MSEEKIIIQANTKTKKLQLATFAAGCFWGVEEAFRKIKGVKSTMVGYTGGRFNNPTYRDVCTDKTGHAEAIQVQFDPNEVSYEGLLNVFWSVHNPTTKNRQGPDIGSQYRSMIAYHTQEQELLAKKSKEDLERSGKFNGRRIVTEIVPASTFYKAEEYHQKYYKKIGGGGSCYI
jgi:peptide-methionine (S)-S-oxide reductase